MSDFEFLFTLFGLLLGFILIELLGGFVRTLKAGRPRPGSEARLIKVGWLTPLLGLFVILDIASYWGNVWMIRAVVPVGMDTIFGGLLILATYYFAASMVFPDVPEDWPILDDWFWRHRRQVLGCLFLINLTWVTFYTLLNPPPESLLAIIGVHLMYFAPLAVAALAPNRWLVGAMFALISVVYLAIAIGEALGRL
jgi:hypothetical protein